MGIATNADTDASKRILDMELGAVKIPGLTSQEHALAGYCANLISNIGL
jgi:hypothetical protein